MLFLYGGAGVEQEDSPGKAKNGGNMDNLPLYTHIRHAMQPTSLAAFKTVDLPRREGQVFECLKKLGSAPNEIIAQALGWKINCVTGRVKRLREKGLVEFAYHAYSQEGIKVMCWRIKCQTL